VTSWVGWFAQNHVAANLAMMLIVVGGLLTIPGITQEVFPEIRPEMITVTVRYPGSTPEEVEEGICIRIEEEIQGVEGVDRITSTANEGVGSVSAELMRGENASEVLDEIKSIVDAIDTFPDESEKPVIQEVVRKRQVIDVVVSGNADEAALKSLAERVRDEITGLPGITHAEVVVARPYEIAVEVSENALRRYGLTFDEVAAAVRRSSLDLPGGSVKTRGGEVLLRTVGQAYRGREFEEIVVRTLPDGSRLTIGDVARVVDGFEDTGQEARFDERPAVMVQVYRVGEQRALDVARRIKEYVESAGRELPTGIALTTWNDNSAVLKSRMDLLLRNGTLGFILVVTILALFLKLRLAFWVSLGIPISFLGALWLLPTLGVSINLISLFAFIVVLGLAVDDAIVVGESIFHYMEQKRSGVDAATAGALRVKTPVVFGILTTVTAFSPLLFLPGMMGQIWRVIPMIVIPVLLFSLFESLFILPAHLSRVKLRDPRVTGWRSVWPRFQGNFDRGLKWFIHNVYERALDLALRWRYVALAIGISTLLITVGVVAGGWIKFTFFPQVRGDDVVALVTMPLGTPREVTAAAVQRMEDAAKQLRREVEEEHGEGAFRHVLASVGEQPYSNRQRRGPIGGGPSSSGEHVGEVNIELAPMEEMDLDAFGIARRWRELVGPVPGAVELVFTSALFTSGEPINVQLASNDLDALAAVAERLKNALSAYPGVFDITDSFRSGKDEVELNLKPEAEALGITLSDLARQVRQAFYGEEAQRVQRGRDDIKVMVRFPEERRKSLGDLETMRIRASGGVEVPFSSVATASFDKGFSTIRRADRQRVINVTADVDLDVGNANEILAAVTGVDLPRILDDHPSVGFSLEGEQRQQSDTLASLRRGLLVAVFVIFALLGVPLRSYTQPLIIMSAIPFGFVGAVWGHLIIGMNLTMLSMAGFVALSGVVVNDSLVMVDFVNRARREGLPLLQAARVSGVVRFRAILLTSLTTFAGVSPLLLERSLQAQFLKPLAVSLGFGVLFATFVIMILVPVSYLILDDLHRVREWVIGLYRRPTLEEEAAS
jgi:multidrug efflux pump subunit AcrB